MCKGNTNWQLLTGLIENGDKLILWLAAMDLRSLPRHKPFGFFCDEAKQLQ